jgi:hypothetical protein
MVKRNGRNRTPTKASAARSLSSGFRGRRPWKALRMQVKGSTEAQLHANKFPSTAKPGDVEAVASFFRAHRFGASA